MSQKCRYINFKKVVTGRKFYDILFIEYSTVGKVGFMYRQSNTIDISNEMEVRV